MRLGKIITREVLEVENIFKENGFGKDFEFLKKVFMVLFYPIGLEPTNEISDVANRRGWSEYSVFRSFIDPDNINPEEVDAYFKTYFLEGKVPPMVKQQCKNYLSSL
tara:strand:- start:3053 stop:3373 length:321 start_codon:yes stop_codon:yes gene_type:complete